MDEGLLANPPSWTDRLDRAATPDEVMAVVRGYVKAQPRELWSSLPIDSQPPALHAPDDVSRYALTLIKQRLETTYPQPPEIEGLSAFFSHASRRLSWVMAANSPRYGKRTAKPRE